MFVRVKKIGGYEYLYLVENVREGGRHVQRVIKALGRRDEVEISGLLDGLIASAARHSRRPSCCPASTVASWRRSAAVASALTWCSASSGERPAVTRCCAGIWAGGASALT